MDWKYRGFDVYFGLSCAIGPHVRKEFVVDKKVGAELPSTA